MTIIALRGIPFERMEDGSSKMFTPFVGADSDGKIRRVGIGLIGPDGRAGCIEGSGAPRAYIIQSWRAMKILERLRQTSDHALSTCWNAAARELDGSALYHLADYVGSLDKAMALREAVLASVPTIEEICALIAIFRENNFEMDREDLAREVRNGLLIRHLLIETVLFEDEARQIVRRRELHEFARPLLREDSLSAFFEDLGIDDLVGGGLGLQTLNQGPIKLSELDRIARKDCANKGEYRLQRAVPQNLADFVPTIAEPTLQKDARSEIEAPWFVSAEGTRFTFRSVKFRDGHFLISGEAVNGIVSAPIVDFTIAELRDKIGPLPSKTPEPLNLFEQLMTAISFLFR